MFGKLIVGLWALFAFEIVAFALTNKTISLAIAVYCILQIWFFKFTSKTFGKFNPGAKTSEASISDRGFRGVILPTERNTWISIPALTGMAVGISWLMINFGGIPRELTIPIYLLGSILLLPFFAKLQFLGLASKGWYVELLPDSLDFFIENKKVGSVRYDQIKAVGNLRHRLFGSKLEQLEQDSGNEHLRRGLPIYLETGSESAFWPKQLQFPNSFSRYLIWYKQPAGNGVVIPGEVENMPRVLELLRSKIS